MKPPKATDTWHYETGPVLFLRLPKAGGAGEMIVPTSQVGIVSTLMINKGTEEEPQWEADEARALVNVMSIGENIIVDKSVAQVWEMLRGG
jgi:hypothetical protein